MPQWIPLHMREELRLYRGLKEFNLNGVCWVPLRYWQYFYFTFPVLTEVGRARERKRGSKAGRERERDGGGRLFWLWSGAERNLPLE